MIYISVKIFENGKVVIRIRDKGCGIEDIEKAKEPLYSTGGEERAGLGFMAVSYTHLDVYKRQELAAKHPDINYIGIDLSPDVLGVARRNIQARYEQEKRMVENVALVAYDIERILQIMNANDEIDRVYINFCNPWPKMRHHKKRLTHTNQLQTYKTFMTDGAQIHFKTDDGGLYQSTMRYLRESGFEILWYTTNLYENGQPPACLLYTS